MVIQLGNNVTVDRLQFRIYSDNEIDKISVMKVVTEEAINNLGHCNKGGLYDGRMGPISLDENCLTCGQRMNHCMGHCGHIDLALPVFNPVFIEFLIKILNVTCIKCFKVQIKRKHVLKHSAELKLLSEGFAHEVLKIGDIVSQAEQSVKERTKITVDGDEITLAQDANQAAKDLTEYLDIKRMIDEFHESICNESTVDANQTNNLRAIMQEAIKEYRQNMLHNKSTCIHCKFTMFRAKFWNSQVVITSKRKIKPKNGEEEPDLENELGLNLSTETVVITPLQVKAILEKAWALDEEAIKQYFPIIKRTTFDKPFDVFFISKLLVIPNKYRPLAKVRGQSLEHESCVLLKSILRLNRCIIYLSELIQNNDVALNPEAQILLAGIQGKSNHQKVDKLWQLLQGNVDNILDADANKDTKQTMRGIKQVLEKKQGLFRSKMMGKRVNHSARSVLAPDPAIATDEVGVPLDFAKHLTYPVPVTQANVDFLRKLVINGGDTYPGALMVKMEDGNVIHLKTQSASMRQGLASQLMTPPTNPANIQHPFKIVYRNLLDGDFVLMNRQPTLHRPSIQAHKVRVMKGVRVLRLPYANCKAYNADFDGDEMNLHFPQNEFARSEAMHLITTHNQYLTPKDGAPLAGLVQDCVVAGVSLSMRGKFFIKEDYFQMVSVALQGHYKPVKTLTPALIMPKRMWSGKQIISTVLHNLIPHPDALPSFNFKTSVKRDVWQNAPEKRWGQFDNGQMTESEFVMRDGELLCGVLDKSAIGSTSHGLIHVCYDLYGGAVASSIITAFNRLFMYYLQINGHTISSKEFLTPSNVAQKRRDDLNALIEVTPKKVLDKLQMTKQQFDSFWETNHIEGSEKNLALIDAAYTQVLGKSTSEITTENERGLFRPGIDNNMRLMVDSGAKGSMVNMNQMASLFGPTAIDGKRMPLSLAGKYLPCFPPYEMDPRAGGYIPDRFMTGVSPSSYFYLCIVGRDSLQHTAVKTANSGYVQRCLIKHLEGIHVASDMTVRNSDNSVLQFQYGEDGLDVTKVPFLSQPSAVDVVVDNYTRMLSPQMIERVKGYSKELPKIEKHQKKVRKYLSSQRNRNKRVSAFTLFCKDTDLKVSGFSKFKGRSEKSLALVREWNNLSTEEREKYEKKALKECPKVVAPTVSQYNSNSNVGVLSEALEDLIDTYYDNNYQKRNSHHRKYTKDTISTTMAMKVLKSHVEAGEAVGAICAQALGEPLTQMTLNTFHFAGRDELNVTLGVPRMVEILRTASAKISTPIMEVPFYDDISPAMAESLKKKFTEVTLKQVLHKVEIETWDAYCEFSDLENLVEKVKIKFILLPTSHYKSELPVTSEDVLKFIEDSFISKGIIKPLQRDDGVRQIKQEEIFIDKFSADKNKMKSIEDREESVEEVTEEKSEEDSDQEESQGDDGLATKKSQAKGNERDYSEDEEEEEKEEREEDEKEVAPAEDEGIGEEMEEKEEEQTDVMENVVSARRSKKKKRNPLIMEREVMQRKLKVKEYSLPGITVLEYEYDTENENWCELTLQVSKRGIRLDYMTTIVNSANNAYVHRINGIKRAFIEHKDGQMTLKTEGVNIEKIVEWNNLLDTTRLYTNDIHLVAKKLGIEATQKSIIREIRAVQKAYNIKIDYRHLSLLADYFTCEGVFKACNRQALATCPSVIQQMTFESTITFLKRAIIEDVPDRMQSPSSRIILGQLVNVGTNVSDAIVDMESAKYIDNYIKSEMD